MTARSLGAAMLVTFTAIASAQSDAKKPKASATEQQLTALEKRWVDAVVKHDAAGLDSVFAPGYVDTDENGHQSNRAAAIAIFKSDDLKFKSINFDELHVHPYGSAAVVTGIATQDGTYKGQAVDSKVAFTDTYLKIKGRWRAVASQRTAIR